MKPQDFKSFLVRIGELTMQQRRALSSAMSNAPADCNVIIEARFGDDPFCPHCASHDIAPWGKTRGLRRFRCRPCRKTFTALTGTPLAGLHKRDVWIDYAAALVCQASVRKAAKRCGIDKTTSFRWRHRFLTRPCEAKARSLRDIVEADETFFLESFKGSRNMQRLPRKRGGKAQKRGLSKEQIPVLIARDRHGAMIDARLPDLSDKAIEDVLGPVIGNDVMLVSDGASRYQRIADKAGIKHVGLNASAGKRCWGIYHIQNVNAYTSRLKDWVRPFKGIATKYLTNYLGWHRMLDREHRPMMPATCLAAALG